MELDDLKNDWVSATNQVNKQNTLSPKIITDMTKNKYYSKIKRIKYPELIGGFVCILGLLFIVVNFNKLDTLFLQSIGVLAILILMIMPILSFLSLTKLNSPEKLDRPYVEIIKQFAIQKLQFLKYQKINAFLSYLLLVTIIIILPKFFYGKDITFYKTFWTFAFSIGYIFLIFFSRWVKKFYSNSLRQAEELLDEIQL